MDQETLGNIVLLVIVTLISVVQNGKGRLSLGRGNKGELICHLKVRLIHSEFSLSVVCVHLCFIVLVSLYLHV